jgi:hypothetical protein
MPKLIEDHSTYTATFRMLATKHLQLNHLKEGDDDIHFLRCVLSKHPMLSQADLSEFIKSVRHRVKVPFMLLVAYSAEYDQSHNDAKRKGFQGEFIILDRVKKDDWDEIEAKIDSTEKIGEDIMGYLIDYYDEHPEDGILEHEQSMNEKISGTDMDNFAGTKFYFTISVPNQAALEFDPAKFDGLTIE